MTDNIEPLNMHGHANTWAEELSEVAQERDELRAEVARLQAGVRGLTETVVSVTELGATAQTDVERLHGVIREYATNLAIQDREVKRLKAQGGKCIYPMHLCIGDFPEMRMLCGRPISDACWTRNPRLVTCSECALESDSVHV